MYIVIIIEKINKLLGDLIQVVFHRALASSSRAVTLVNPERFLGNNFQRVWHTLRNTLRLV